MGVRMIGLGTANPPLRLSQEEIYQAYATRIPLSEGAQSLLQRLFMENRSIAFRHLGMDTLDDALRNSQDDLIARFEKFAVPTAVEAARKALDEAGLATEQADALVVNTCTGYLCPGLTSYIAETLSLRPDVRPFDLVGMGCGGALPALETAYNFLQVHPGRQALVISVEMCSATIFFSDDADVLVSNAIFGDGAAAAVLTNDPGDSGIRLSGFAAGLFPEDRKHLRYATQEGKLRNVLSRRVPVLGAQHGHRVAETLLNEHDLALADVDHWLVHPGGEKVLQAFQRELDLPDEALLPAWRVLRDYGNMSSPTVLFVLEEVRRTCSPQPGQIGLLCSFGAGFSAFAGLVEFL